mgnify:CR=1 FL=1
MKPTKSEVDAVIGRLSELSTLIGVSHEELLTFIRVLSKASWANVEFEPLEGLKFEFEGLLGGWMKLEVTARKGNTTVIKEYRIPEFFLREEGPELCLKPVRGPRKKSRNKKYHRKRFP